MIHNDLTLERWSKFSLAMQLANVGCDVERTIQWKKKGNLDFSEKSFVEDLNDIKKKKGIQNVYAVLNAVPAKELTYKGFNYGYYEESKNKKKRNLFGRDKAAL